MYQCPAPPIPAYHPRMRVGVGILGGGTVGGALARKLLDDAPAILGKAGVEFELVKVAVRDLSKIRPFPSELLTDDPAQVIDDERVHLACTDADCHPSSAPSAPSAATCPSRPELARPSSARPAGAPCAAATLRLAAARANTASPPGPSWGKGTRRVQLVRRDGRDVSTLYGREGGGGRPPRWRSCRPTSCCTPR